MTQAPFYLIARQRRRLALARWRRHAVDWQGIPARDRAPRVTRAVLVRLMGR